MMAPTNIPMSRNAFMHGQALHPVGSPNPGSGIHPAVQDMHDHSGNFVRMVNDDEARLVDFLTTVPFNGVEAVLARYPGNLVLRFMAKFFPSYLQFFACRTPPVFDQSLTTLGEFVNKWENGFFAATQVSPGSSVGMIDPALLAAPSQGQNAADPLSCNASNVTGDSFPELGMSPVVETQVKANTLHKRESRAKQYRAEVDKARAERDEAIRKMAGQHHHEIENLKANYTVELDVLKVKYDKELQTLRDKHDAVRDTAMVRMAEHNHNMTKRNSDLALHYAEMIKAQDEIRTLRREVAVRDTRISDLTLTTARLQEESDAAAMRAESPSFNLEDLNSLEGLDAHLWHAMQH